MIKIVLSIIIVIACIILTASVVMQEGQDKGLGAISGSADTFFGKSKARGADALLKKVTIAAAVVLMVLVVVMNCL